MAEHLRARFVDRLTLRVRVCAAATIAVALALGGASLALIESQYREQSRQLDREAVAALTLIAAIVAEQEPPHPLPTARDSLLLCQVVNRQGKIVAYNPNAMDLPPISGFVSFEEADGAVHKRSVVVQGARSVEFVTNATRGPDRYAIYVVAPLRPLETSRNALRGRLLAFSPLVLLITVALLWVVIGRALRPVERMREMVARISPTDLSARVGVPQADDEIRRLGLTMNELLDRLEASAQRQARFVSDASHELRSPLAAIRARLEVAIRANARVQRPAKVGSQRAPFSPAAPVALRGVADPTDEPNWPTVAGDVLRESVRMERLVADLLSLAGRDANADPPPFNDVDLDEVVLHECATARLLRPVQVDTSKVSAGRVQGNADQLHRLCANLLDNATRHAKSRVVVSLTMRTEHSENGRSSESGGAGALRSVVELCIADDGKGIAEADRERVFQRFTRLDQARDRGVGGSGLGLAIVQEIATAHHGSVRVETSASGGAELIVCIPIAESADLVASADDGPSPVS